MPYLIALDEGTTSARTVLYNERGERLAMESRPIASVYPQPGWVEQDPMRIWSAQMESARAVLDRTGISASALAGIGVTNQRETAIVWDRATGEPVYPAIVWQCRRTAQACAELAASHGDRITARTGLVVDPYFSASKIHWILENVPSARERARAGDLLFGTVDAWLIWKLTDGAVHATDPSNASRTMLFNIETGDWDDELLSLFDVPRSMLPRVLPSSSFIAYAAGGHLGAAVPVTGIAGDQQAALFGQACFRPGLSKNTYGTGCFCLLHTGGTRPISRNRMLATRAAEVDGAQFAMEGSVFTAGAAVQWLRDRMGLIAHASESEAIASAVSGNAGVYMVPAFAGLGAPHWDPSARGTITGITAGVTSAHIVRATLESIAYQTREIIEAMESDSGERVTELRVDGGASANNFLMQFQAGILGARIVRPADIETTALGAAYLAGLAAGVWKSTGELESFWRAGQVFEPAMSQDERERLWEGWNTAVRKCRA